MEHVRSKPAGKSRRRTLVIASLIGLGICAGGLVVLVRALEPSVSYCEGQPVAYWLGQVNSPEVGVSNRACGVLNRAILPKLIDTMFHDTNDSQFKIALINHLNDLPGVDIHFEAASRRRVEAAQMLGTFGPPAKAAIPDLVKAIRGNDAPLRIHAAVALGQIHSEPETVIPLLIGLLDDPQDGEPEAAMQALGDFGSLAKAAVPRLVPLLKSREKDTRHAASAALRQIDPEAATKAATR
jgi:HEAT repeat protein